MSLENNPIDPHIFKKRSIKYHVRKYLLKHANEFRGKTVIDIPAGSGSTAEILNTLSADVKAFDLFPEYFRLDGVKCVRADVTKGIPVNDHSADFLLCQEGIEHFSDQLAALKEFNRVLVNKGRLIITTPNYSSLASKLSYLVFENEYGRRMPPNELDDIWMSDKSITPEIYYGHLFLIGIQRLRALAKLAGFRVMSVQKNILSKGSLFLFPFLYPLIAARSIITYRRCMRKSKLNDQLKKEVYFDQLRLNLSLTNLLNKHLFIVFEKELDVTAITFGQEKLMVNFEQRT